MPMNTMMIVIMMVMARWGIEAWASETALGQRGWEDDSRALTPKGEQGVNCVCVCVCARLQGELQAARMEDSTNQCRPECKT